MAMLVSTCCSVIHNDITLTQDLLLLCKLAACKYSCSSEKCVHRRQLMSASLGKLLLVARALLVGNVVV